MPEKFSTTTPLAAVRKVSNHQFGSCRWYIYRKDEIVNLLQTLWKVKKLGSERVYQMGVTKISHQLLSEFNH